MSGRRVERRIGKVCEIKIRGKVMPMVEPMDMVEV
jgi:hypothetical protein